MSLSNLGNPLDPVDGVVNDTGLTLAVPSVEALAIKQFYMPDFKAVAPTDESEAYSLAMNLDYDGWIVAKGENGTYEDMPLATQSRQYPDPTPKGSFWDAFKAGAVTENELLSATANTLQGQYYAPEAGYDPQNEELYKSTVYAPYAKKLVFAQSKPEFDAIISQIDSELDRRQVMEKNGAGAITGMLGGQVVSPMFWASMLLPEIAAIRAGRPLKAAAELAFYAGVQEGGAELIKMDTQLTRTAEEAMTNIGAAVLLGGVLGGGVAAFSKGQMDQVVAKTVDDLKTDKPIVRDPDFGDAAKLSEEQIDSLRVAPGKDWNDSLSAARVTPDDPDWWKLEAAAGFEKLPLNPIVRLSNSASLTARKMTTWLVNNPYYLKGHAKGINLAGSIGSAEARTDMLVANTNAYTAQLLQDTFARYRGLDKAGKETFVGSIKATAADVTGATARAGKMTWDDFKVAVAKQMRGTADSDVPEVVEAAKGLREKVYNPFLKNLKDLDLLSSEIGDEYASKYLHRMWDSAKIKADSKVTDVDGRLIGGLAKILADHFEKKQKELLAKMDYWKKQTGDSVINTQSMLAEKQAAEATEEVAAEVGAVKALLQADFDPNSASQVKTVLGMDSKPQSLGEALRKAGGLYDARGELRARDITNKSYPGLITSDPRKGLTEDRLRQWAYDNGWTQGIPPQRMDVDGNYTVGGYEEIDLNELLDDLAAEVTGSPSSRVKKWPYEIEMEVKDRLVAADSPYFDKLKKAGLGRRSSEADIKAFILKERGTSTEAFDEYIQGLRKSAKEGQIEYMAMLKARDEVAEFLTLGREGLEKLAEDSVDTILSKPGGLVDERLIPSGTVVKASSLKERLLDIDDAAIEDYLISDVEHLTKAYANTVAPQMELQRTFGDYQMKEIFENIRVEHRQAREAIASQMTEKGASAEAVQKRMSQLHAEEARNIKDVEALRDKILGQFNKPDDPDGFWIRASQFVKRYNLLRSLGGMQIAALTDIARPIMVKGFRPFMRTMKGINSSAWKLSVQELKKAGVGYEAILNSRMRSWSDVTDDLARRNKFEKGVDSLAMGFGKATGMSFHNDFAKSFSGVMIQDEILRAAQKLARGEKLTMKQMRDAAKSGLGEKELKAIGEEMAKGRYVDEGGLMAPRTDNWDTDTALALRSAVRKSVDEVIVTVGKGEMPLWMSKELGSHVMQFKSFLVSSHSKVLMSGLQQKDMAALEGLMAAVAIGYAVSVIKDRLGNNPGTFTNKEFGAQLTDAVDRAGVMGWMMEPYGIVNKMSGGQIAVARLWGGEADQLSRYQSRNLMGSIGGVSTDLLGDVSAVTSALATGEISEGDVNAARKLIPYQNLWYMDKLFDSISEGAKDNFVTK